MGGAVAYDYTDNGYRAHRYEGDSCIGYEYTTTGQLKRVAHYDYNAEGEGSWELDTSEYVITYQLDAAGRRVAKLVDGVVDEKYLWAGHNTTLLAVYKVIDDEDVLWARFEYGVGRMPVRMTQNSATYYFAYDQVGSLRAVFDSSGNVVHEITYDSYGNIITDETTEGFGSVYIPPFGFAGGLHDRDTGMVLFGFRDYDPETSTWLTPDPIGFAGGDTYLYGYCGGDPVNLFDHNALQGYNYNMSIIPSDEYSAIIGDMISGVQDIVSEAIGSNYDSTMDMFSDFVGGKEPEHRYFWPGSPESMAMNHSLIVANAWDYFLKQNAGRSWNEMRKVPNIRGEFGGSGFMHATFERNWTEHFVGSARVDIYPNADGIANVVIENTTSATSFFYRFAPSWDRGRIKFFGNMRQTYVIKRQIPKTNIR